VARVIVLDASVLIAYLDASDLHHGVAEGLLAREIDDEFAVNSLTLAEVLVGPAHDGRLESVIAILDDLEVRTLPLPADAATRLARLRATSRLRMPDCCVLLTADEEEARVATFDARLADAAERHGLTVLMS
jgi:predicted nucleic acid-binding protein